ncbi:MAG: CHAT domain-containing protein [candidate division Zixibacteria bacterium]|nr:CHAT domain-containing protein [candidate division Zixibacteria bacterium]
MIALSHIQSLENRRRVAEYVTRKYQGDLVRFIDDVDNTINTLLRTDLEQAGRIASAMVRVFGYLPKEYKPRLLAIRGRVAHWTGDEKAALRYYRRARDIYQRRGDAGRAAKLGKGLMEVYRYLGRYDEALEIGKTSLRYFRRHGLNRTAGEVMNNIGNVYHRMDNNRMALKYYDWARDIFAKDGGIPLAVVEYNRANIYANLNRLDEAERLYATAAKLYETTGMHIAKCQAKYSLAYLYFLGHKYTQALKTFEEVYDDFGRLGDRKSSTVTQLDIAEINIQLNQFGSAIAISEDIIPTFQILGMTYEQAKALFFASEARARLGDYHQSLQQLKKARRLFIREGNILWQGMVNIARSRLLVAQKRYPQALAAAAEAIRQFSRSGDIRRKNDAEIARLDVLVASGKHQQGFRLADRLAKRKLVGYQRYNLDCLVGRCLFERREYTAALAKYKSGVRNVEKMLTGLYPDEIRHFFVIDKYDCYKMVVDCLLKMGRYRDSFMTNLRALEIINGEFAFASRLEAEVPRELLDQRNALRAALKRLHHPSKSDYRQESTDSVYYVLEHQLWSTERKMRSCLYPEHPSRNRTPLVGGNLQTRLEPDETIVNFISMGTRTGAFCVTLDRVRFIEFNVSTTALEVVLRKLHFIFENSVYDRADALAMKEMADEHLREIYSDLIAPLQPYLAGNRILILADSPFNQIPFHALRDHEGRYLNETLSMHIAINPNDMEYRRMSPAKWQTRRNAVFAVSSDLLPSIETETGHIKKAFSKAHVYMADKATCDNLTRELCNCTGFVHIAAHASRSSENPLFSRILLYEGPFFPFDLFKSGVKAQLVTLSGCQTAAPGLYYGNSFSLAKAFHQAGGRYVLASLWPVSDDISMGFMMTFYRALADKKDIQAAYRSALQRMSDSTNNPAFWGAFVLLGV